ncbi:MAG: hemerythrin domain-containing protein [Caulobacteraceae bacterium]
MSAFDKIVDAVTPPESAEKRAEARAEARAAAAPGDWLSAILDHHEAIEEAFAAAGAAGDAAQCRAALKRLGELLNGHSMAEEAVVYPALAEMGKGGHAEMAYTEQVAAKLQLAALETMDPLSEDYRDKLGHLQGAVAHHIYKEESDWFIDLKREAAPATQQRIARRYAEEYGRYIRGGETIAGAGRLPGEERSFSPGAGSTPPPVV